MLDFYNDYNDGNFPNDLWLVPLTFSSFNCSFLHLSVLSVTFPCYQTKKLNGKKTRIFFNLNIFNGTSIHYLEEMRKKGRSRSNLVFFCGNFVFFFLVKKTIALWYNVYCCKFSEQNKSVFLLWINEDMDGLK